MAVVVITTAQEDVKRRRINPHRTEDRLRKQSGKTKKNDLRERFLMLRL